MIETHKKTVFYQLQERFIAIILHLFVDHEERHRFLNLVVVIGIATEKYKWRSSILSYVLLGSSRNGSDRQDPFSPLSSGSFLRIQYNFHLGS